MNFQLEGAADVPTSLQSHTHDVTDPGLGEKVHRTRLGQGMQSGGAVLVFLFY